MKLKKKKTIVHIFNSKYFLDKKEIENLPIGLFGDFYSQELSFSLLNSNDYKNLNNICLLYTSPSPRDAHESRMPSSA